MKLHFSSVLLVVLLAACEPATFEPVPLTAATPEFVPLISDLSPRGGFDTTTLKKRADGGGRHLMRRYSASAVGDRQTELQAECVRSAGGTIIRAQRMTFPEGDVGVLVTCSL
jgi:hypothetical protein